MDSSDEREVSTVSSSPTVMVRGVDEPGQPKPAVIANPDRGEANVWTIFERSVMEHPLEIVGLLEANSVAVR